MSRTIKFITLTFSEGLNVLVGLLFLPYLARAMAIDDYGTYGQTLMIVALFRGIFALGLAKVIFSYLANTRYTQGESLLGNIVACLSCGIISMMAVILISPLIAMQFDNEALNLLILIYAFSLPFSMVASSLNSALIFFDKVKSAASIVVVCNLIKVTLVVLAVQIYNSLPLIICALILVEVFRMILNYIFIPSEIKNSLKWTRKNSLEQIKVGWPLGIASILGVAFYSTDGYMISALLDVEQYAIYRNGAFQIPFISSIYGAVTAILLPDVSRYFFEKKYDEIVRLKRKVITNTAMLIFPMVIFCIIFAKPLIVIYLSEKYMASYPIFMIYNIVLLTRFTSYDDLFIATNNNNRMPKIYLMALILNIVLNYFLIQSMGPVGAAIASVFSFYFLVILLFRTGVTFINKKVIEFFDVKKLVGALLLSIVSGILFYGASSFISLNAITVLVVMMFYALITYHIIIKFGFIESSIIRGILIRGGANNVLLKLFNKMYA